MFDISKNIQSPAQKGERIPAACRSRPKIFAFSEHARTHICQLKWILGDKWFGQQQKKKNIKLITFQIKSSS